MALSNYIGNLCFAIDSIDSLQAVPSEKRLFGSRKNHRKFVKKLDIYGSQMLDHFVIKKDFHSDFLGEVLPGVEENFQKLNFDDETSSITTLDENSFYSIFLDFMRSLKLDYLFDEFIQNHKIYRTIREEDDKLLGFTLNNPITHESDVFVGNFPYDIHTMSTLAHEFGHVYDLSFTLGDVEEFNQYFYLSFFGEVIPRLFERLFFQFMIDKGILTDEIKDKVFEFEVINHDYLLGCYILSLINENSFLDNSYQSLSKDELIQKVKNYFISEDTIRDFVYNSTGFDVLEDFRYAYGDIVSLFLKEAVEDCGLSNDFVEEFLKIRSGLFSEDFLRKWGMGPENYVQLHEKELQMIKK